MYVFPCMLSHAVQKVHGGVYLQVSLDGSLFHLRSLKAKSKCLHNLTQDAHFADDCVHLTQKSKDLQLMLDRLSEGSRAFGLTL